MTGNRPLPLLKRLVAMTAMAMAVIPWAPAGASEIRIGMSAAFSGASKGLGIELYRGAMTYFEHINRQGGVNGHTIRLLAKDDGYNPIPAIENTIAFVEDEGVFCLFSYVGTPTVTRVLPLLKSYRKRHIYLLFPFTGAQPQREFPYSDFVFNLRSSYYNETAGLVDNLVGVGRSRIAIFYQADAYGRSGWEGVRRGLAKYDLKIVAEATYRRGAAFSESFQRQAEILMASDADAVISIGAYAACAGFIRDVRNAGWEVPIANVSFVDSENMLGLLKQEGQARGADYTRRLINSQVVPCCKKSKLSAVAEYHRLIHNTDIQLPEKLQDSAYQPLVYSSVSLEGFLNAKLMVEIIRRMGATVDRSRIKPVIEAMRSFDIGIDHPVRFGPEKHQALDAVYYTTVRQGMTVPISDWNAWSK
jgi:branched-chain amino acid transport system substrate-binding protein